MASDPNISDLTEEDFKAAAALETSEKDTGATFKYDEEYQRELLGMVCNDKAFMIDALALCRPSYFDNDAHKIISRIAFQHFEKYKVLPTRAMLTQQLREEISAKTDEIKAHYLGELGTVLGYYVPGVESREAYRDKITNFAKMQSLRHAFHTCLDEMKKAPDEEATWARIYETLRETFAVERNFDIGLDYFQTYEERYARMNAEVENGEIFTSAFPDIDNALMGGGLTRGEMASWVGLCFRKGTRVRMFDGTTKAVEAVRVGDRLMGDDSTARIVKSLARGRDMMYEVKPVKGDSYYVNSQHVLSLRSCHKQGAKKICGYRRPRPSFYGHPARIPDSDVFNISVSDFLRQSSHFKKSMKGYRVGVEYPERPVKIAPYILGCWLGDGDRHQAALTNMDESVVRIWQNEAKARGLSVRQDGIRHFVHHHDQTKCPPGKGTSLNTLLNDLRGYGLLKGFDGRRDTGHKHVPHDYMVNSRQVRLEVLAGLIDTDGSRSFNGYDFSNKSKLLAHDVMELARSVGLAAYSKPCKKTCNNNGKTGNYWRGLISGDCSQVPVRITRKRCSRRLQIKDHLATGITVTPVGEESYYGFSVDGNHLFLLADYTVTHNSGSGKSLALVAAALANLHKGKRVLYISLEIDQDGVAERFDAQLADPTHKNGVTIKNLYEKKEFVFQALKEYTEEKEDHRLLVIKRFPGGQMGMSDFRAYHSQLKLQGFPPDLIIIDYIGEMKDVPGVPVHESRYMITRDLRGFAVDELVCVMTAMQPNRSAKDVVRNGMLIDDDNLGDSYAQIKPLDAMWTINQLQEEKECGLARIFVAKHRSGDSRFTIHIQFNYDTLSMTQISTEKYEQILKKYRMMKETTTTEKMREVMQEKQANDIINNGGGKQKKASVNKEAGEGKAPIKGWDNSDAGYNMNEEDAPPPEDLKVD